MRPGWLRWRNLPRRRQRKKAPVLYPKNPYPKSLHPSILRLKKPRKTSRTELEAWRVRTYIRTGHAGFVTQKRTKQDEHRDFDEVRYASLDTRPGYARLA